MSFFLKLTNQSNFPHFACKCRIIMQERNFIMKLFKNNYLTLEIDAQKIPKFEIEVDATSEEKQIHNMTLIATNLMNICSYIKYLSYLGFTGNVGYDEREFREARLKFLFEVAGDAATHALYYAMLFLLEMKCLSIPADEIDHTLSVVINNQMKDIINRSNVFVQVLSHYPALIPAFYNRFRSSIDNTKLISAFIESCNSKVPLYICSFLHQRIQINSALTANKLSSAFEKVILNASDDCKVRLQMVLELNHRTGLQIRYGDIASRIITWCRSPSNAVDMLDLIYESSGAKSPTNMSLALRPYPLILLSAQYSLECMMYLIEQSSDWLFVEQSDGNNKYYAIHCCCLKSSQPEALHLLLRFAKSKNILSQLFSQHNFRGQTALLQLIIQPKFKVSDQLFIHLLSHGCQGDSNALHHAIIKNNLFQVRALFVFDAHLDGDYDVKLESTEMKDTIQDMKRYWKKLDELKQEVADSKEEKTIRSSSTSSNFSNHNNNNNNNKVNVLCMDGGGIRGLILIETLEIIEYSLNRSIPRIFKFIAGTSTGGLLSCALLKLSVKQCKQMYFDMAYVLFGSQSNPYDNNHLDTLANEHFPNDPTVDDLNTTNGTRVLCTSVNATTDNVSLHCFRSYAMPVNGDRVAHENEFKDTNVPISVVMKATSAAPYYFKPVRYNNQLFLDGGLLANNPAVISLSELACLNVGVHTMLSLGTGYYKPPANSSSDLFARERVLTFRKPNTLANILSDVAFANKMKDILTEACTHTHDSVPIARSWCQQIGAKFIRIDPILDEEIPLDTTDIHKLVDMVYTTRIKRLLDQEWDKVSNIVKTLKIVM